MSGPSSSSATRSSSKIRKSMQLAKEQLRSYNMSIIALCGAVLVMFYVLGNLFPYSGFMVMKLIDGVDEETSGKYAGPLVSSFMIGRGLGSYPWGKIADIYGRRFVLIASLLNAAFFSVLFGLSTSYTMALITRFCLGLGNGLMLVARCSITELARGDREKESKGMGYVMSMAGYGMLISPALGGALSDPVKQYPEHPWFGGKFDDFLSKYPFFPPNALGTVFTLMVLVLAFLCVEETLPEDKIRSSKYILIDFCNLLKGWFCCCCPCAKNTTDYETVGEATTATVDDAMDDDEDDEDDDEDDNVNIFRTSNSSDLADVAALATKKCRKSCVIALHRPSANSERSSSSSNYKHETDKLIEEEEAIEVAEEQKEVDEKDDETIPIMSRKSTRGYLIAYWINCFANVAYSDGFPLFAMSPVGGLSIEEKDIGSIAAVSGLIFTLIFHPIFTWSMAKFGLLQLTRLSSLLGCIAIFLPLSVLISPWYYQFAFVSFWNAMVFMFHSFFCSCITIGTNRTVPASQRATLQGISSIGASVGRGLAPMIAGVLISFSFSGKVISPDYGSIPIYMAMEVFAIISYISTLFIVEE